MTALINFVFFILGGLLSLLWWAIVISAILSWLVAFDVINRRNNAVYQILDFLDRVTGPVLRPFQRVIPSLGGVDISPIIVLLIISGVQNYLLPALRMTLVRPGRLTLGAEPRRSPHSARRPRRRRRLGLRRRWPAPI